MWFVVMLLIFMTVYVTKNQKMQEQIKTGYFATVGIFSILWIVGSIIF